MLRSATLYPEISVQQTPDEKWGLYVNGILIGDSKHRFDADHSAVMLRRALGTPIWPGRIVDLMPETELPTCQEKCPACAATCTKNAGHATAGYDGIAGLCWCNTCKGWWLVGEKYMLHERPGK